MRMGIGVPLPPLARGGKQWPGGQSRREPDRAEPRRAESEPVNRGEPEASVAQTPSWREAAKALPLLVPTARPPVSRDLLTLNSPLASQQGSRDRRRLAVPVTAPRRRGTLGQRPRQIACRGRSERPRSRDGTDPRDISRAQAPPPWSWMTRKARIERRLIEGSGGSPPALAGRPVRRYRWR